MTSIVRALHRSSEYTFAKEHCESVQVIAGIGIEGDAHAGATVRHRSRIERDPNQPNLRQVHLFDGEILDMLAAEGFGVAPGLLGENITTAGLGTLSLPTGTLLRVGNDVLLGLTGLRNPCVQIEAHFPGLLKRMVHRTDEGVLERLTGAMSVVLQAGEIRVGDHIQVQLPPGTRQEMQLV